MNATADSSSLLRGSDVDRYRVERRALWDLRRLLWKISPRDVKQHKALSQCRRYPRGDFVGLRRRPHKNGYRVHASELVVCGKPICPLCGPKIAAERAADIALALTAHYANGGRVAMVTLTLRHTRAQRLTDLLDGVANAWTSIRQNKTPRGLMDAHTVGYIKRLEVTEGGNGWHPHLHVLVFLAPDADDQAVHGLASSMYATWAGRLVRQGLGEPTEEHGLDCKILDLATAHEKIADYAAKAAALELASAGTKRGRRRSSRTPLQILHDLAKDGLAVDRAKWFEYVEAMHGRHHLRWSDGLRVRLLGHELTELTDEQAAESDDGLGRLLGVITRETWLRICSSKYGPTTLFHAGELYADEDEATDSLARYLDRHGLGHLLEAGLFNPPGAT